MNDLFVLLKDINFLQYWESSQNHVCHICEIVALVYCMFSRFWAPGDFGGLKFVDNLCISCHLSKNRRWSIYPPPSNYLGFND